MSDQLRQSWEGEDMRRTVEGPAWIARQTNTGYHSTSICHQWNSVPSLDQYVSHCTSSILCRLRSSYRQARQRQLQSPHQVIVRRNRKYICPREGFSGIKLTFEAQHANFLPGSEVPYGLLTGYAFYLRITGLRRHFQKGCRRKFLTI